MSPLLKRVQQAGIEGVKGKANPVQITPADFFTPTEALRGLFAKLIHCPDPRQIVIIPSVSYGIATAAKNINLKHRERVVVLAEQFPSNYYQWHRLCDENGGELVVVKAPDSEHRGAAWNERLLEAIDDNTRVVAIPHVHWADGTLFDLKAIRKKCNAVGAFLIIDGTQSVGALPMDIAEVQPDALICAGYKWLLGPYSLGLAYFGERFNNGVPLEENWINRADSENFAGLVNYNRDYQDGALRYEVGEHSNFILVPMLTEALRQMNDCGVASIQQYCQRLFTDTLTTLPKERFIIEEEAYRSHHLFGIRLKQAAHMEALKQHLQEEKISVSIRGNAIRVAPHVYNDAPDIAKFTAALMSIYEKGR